MCAEAGFTMCVLYSSDTTDNADMKSWSALPPACRLINPQTMMLGQEPRQTTSNLGHLNKPSIQVAVQAKE